MNYEAYIKPELLILAPVLYLIGIALKKSRFADRWIPCLLGTVSVFLCAVWTFATSEINSMRDVALALFIAMTQGVLIAGTDVYISQLYIQSHKNKSEKN